MEQYKFNIYMRIIINNVRELDDLYKCIKLEKNNISLYILEANFLRENHKKLKKFLTEKQRSKSKKYFFLEDRYNYIVTHAVVNIIFYKIYGKVVRDENIKFNNGKPYIDNYPKFNYNISHTKGCSVVAFCEKKVGIDIEGYNKIIDYNDILKKYFFYETESFKDIDLKFFYTLWTIKESYLKFTEIGIRGLDSVDVIKIKNNHAVVKNIYNNETIYVKIIYLNNKFVISLCI